LNNPPIGGNGLPSTKGRSAGLVHGTGSPASITAMVLDVPSAIDAIFRPCAPKGLRGRATLPAGSFTDKALVIGQARCIGLGVPRREDRWHLLEEFAVGRPIPRFVELELLVQAFVLKIRQEQHAPAQQGLSLLVAVGPRRKLLVMVVGKHEAHCRCV